MQEQLRHSTENPALWPPIILAHCVLVKLQRIDGLALLDWNPLAVVVIVVLMLVLVRTLSNIDACPLPASIRVVVLVRTHSDTHLRNNDRVPGTSSSLH